MSYDARSQLLEHVVLKIVVILIERLFGLATACFTSCGKHLLVIVNGRAVDVMHRADEVINDGMLSEFANVSCAVWTYELSLEANEDMNL